MIMKYYSFQFPKKKDLSEKRILKKLKKQLRKGRAFFLPPRVWIGANFGEARKAP
jgi:hypothetical protein